MFYLGYRGESALLLALLQYLLSRWCKAFDANQWQPLLTFVMPSVFGPRSVFGKFCVDKKATVPFTVKYRLHKSEPRKR